MNGSCCLNSIRSDLAGLARIPQSDSQGVDEAERGVAILWRDGAAVDAVGLHLETHLDLVALQVRELNTLNLGHPLREIRLTG